MNITDVRVRRAAREGKMRAIVSVTFDNEFVVHDIKVIDGENGLFIAMPSKKGTDGTYRDVAHPINKETRNILQDSILAAYNEALEKMPADGADEEGYVSDRWAWQSGESLSGDQA